MNISRQFVILGALAYLNGCGGQYFDPDIISAPISNSFVPISNFESGELKAYNDEFIFKHFAYSMYTGSGQLWTSEQYTQTSTLPVHVLENQYLKVTLLPQLGGRILSIVYKPTGHELLYQNQVGAPYLANANIFYWDWLMIIGGIFPTFPEPEHGKTWHLPWSSELVETSDEKISVRMRFEDNITFGTAPPQYINSATGLVVETTTTLHKNRTDVQFHVKLFQRDGQPVARYEYWTNGTYAPGSTPGNTWVPGNTEIILPVTQVTSDSHIWGWMGSVDETVDRNNRVYEFKNLAWMKNWLDHGISYAYPRMTENWHAIINHDQGAGVVRTGDNTITPGLKIWTFGFDADWESKLGDPANFNRPTIELWSGHTQRFFQSTSLAAQEVKEWTEYFYPTQGLGDIKTANEHVALDVDQGIFSFYWTEPSGTYIVDFFADQTRVGSLPIEASTQVARINTSTWTENLTNIAIRKGATELLNYRLR